MNQSLNYENPLNASKPKISAIVQIGKISTDIVLEELAKGLSINNNILYVEFGSTISKGDRNKKQSKKKERKYFYNQITTHLNVDKRINMKIFNNGRIQMTGIKELDQGEKTIRLLLSEIDKLSPECKNNSFNSEKIEIVDDVRTVLINSDFDIYNKINRVILHRLICDNGYYSSYEPCIYPGVNIKYYSNPLRNNFGICDCDKHCNGKGLDNSCKRITIAVFNSGKIMITGANNMNHVETAYKFITEFIYENKEKILIKSEDIIN